ncbi:MAG: mevalonate kinase [Nitrososphaerales archaeon]|nr:mevalonate kinase [Nitrososphaerales archaeon]
MRASAEAPCKAIITGEHFVVHGAWALAAAIGRNVRVDIQPSDRFSMHSHGYRLSRDALLPAERVVETLAREFSFKPSLRVEIRSDVPAGAGLGSSASTMVALVAALSRLKSLRLGRQEIIDFAMVGEKEVHGRPSGIDVNACALGGVLLYKVGTRPKRVRLNGARKLLIVYSGRKRSTRRLINRVSGAKESHPGLFSGLAASVSEVTRMAADRLVRGDMSGLGRLLTLNHAAVAAVGASNAVLDGLVDLLVSMGCPGAKLTGAGGGGSVIAVPPKGKAKSTTSELRRRGFEAFEARIPVEGVVSWLKR